MRQTWELPGGVHPPQNKEQSLRHPIAECPLVDEMILPLNQHIGAPSAPLVAVGDRVKKYQCIAEAQGIMSAYLHAPTSGEIIAIEDRLVAHPSGLSAPCIVLKSDGDDESITLNPCEAPFALSHEDIIERIRHAGIAGMGGAGFPAAIKLKPHAETPIDTLIVNGTECEPYITADDVLMQHHADDLVLGTLIFAHVLNRPKNILIGIEDNKPAAIAAVQKAARDHSIEGIKAEVVTFPTKYPSGGEKQLIYILTGKEVASGQRPAHLGIVMQNVGTAVAAWRSVRYGEPLIERITTVVGEALAVQRHLKVRIGTPINRVLSENGFRIEQSPRLIMGGPMMGFALEQTSVPVVKTTNCLIAPSYQEMPGAPPQQPCIRCGHCAEACPAGLLPQQLFWYAEANDHEKLHNHNLFDCIECGACSYVCPSSIPLVQYYRNAKGKIRQADADKRKADRARLRFEQRNERLAEVAAAKEAKRQARKAVAERNKAQLAEQQAAGANDIVTKAVSDVKARNADKPPEQERAKLARTRDSLHSKIESLREQIRGASGDATRIATLTARLKQTELKANDAERKLSALDASNPKTEPLQHEHESDVKAAAETSVNPVAQREKNLGTLRKRLNTAREKLAEAEAANKPTVAALRQGVLKLQASASEANEALIAAQNVRSDETHKATISIGTQDAAQAAIDRAKANTQAIATMSAEEKQASIIASLEKRLEKARARWQKAQANNDENVDAFAVGVEKLEKKLLAAKSEGTP